MTGEATPVSHDLVEQLSTEGKIKRAPAVTAGVQERTTAWYTWKPGAYTDRVRMRVYQDYASDGLLHDDAWGEAELHHGPDEVYVDVSDTGTGDQGQLHSSGSTFTTANGHYDGPGYRIRVCGAQLRLRRPVRQPAVGLQHRVHAVELTAG